MRNWLALVLIACYSTATAAPLLKKSERMSQSMPGIRKATQRIKTQFEARHGKGRDVSVHPLQEGVFIHPDGAITVDFREDGDTMALMTVSPRGGAHLYDSDRMIDRRARVNPPKVRAALQAVKQWIADGSPVTESPAKRVVEAIGQRFLKK
jgi:hypothetical protein